MLKLYRSAKSYLKNDHKPETLDAQVAGQVAEILAKVQFEGDAALQHFTEKFDGIDVRNIRVPAKIIDFYSNRLESETREMMSAAVENVRNFHKRQVPNSWTEEEKDGSRFGMKFTPIANVGIYVPGGTAGYPSTVIMTVVPAQIAGVERIVLVSPPTKDGLVNPLVLAAAGLLGVQEVYAIGGAQAIAALAFGTETVSRVDKIVGPGNIYVNEAKRQVFGAVGIDALAGPTELVILADETSNPDFVVRDLFAQAEHDVDARVICITPSLDLAKGLQSKAQQLLPKSERNEILEKSISTLGAIVLVSNLKEGAALVNQIAPEHVQIMVRHPHAILFDIRNAGAICLGEYTPAVVGDYFAGPNHVLPTNRTARFSSPLNVLDFMKFSSVLEYSQARFRDSAPQIARFADLEGFANHENAITYRDE